MRTRPIITLAAIAALLPSVSSAGDPPPGLGKPDLFVGFTESKIYQKVKITHYSATPIGGRQCRYENGIGGRDESSSGFRPLAHRIDKPGLIYGRPATLAALPQEGGTRGAYKCFFALPDAYPGKLFYGGDFYGPDSNGLMKTDISSPCTEIVNVTKFSKMVVYDCGKQAQRVGPLYQKLARENKPAPAPLGGNAPPDEISASPRPAPEELDPRSCPWYAVASCAKSRDGLSADLDRLGSGFEIIDTEVVPSFKRGWYCVVGPSKDKAGADAKLEVAKKKSKSAYLKKGC